MKINYKTTTKVLLCIVAYDTAVNCWNLFVVAPKDKKRFAALTEERNNAWTAAHLLAQRMDAEGIELDMFDEIALNNLYPKK